ncbi:fungal-specific transcription factor domain-containing protein [Aspergillus coremiiformis]|uniref:Fungal-specific transcription factor domain-containing protein n=1 Tax=Aspergillus coremiiformis TaxID=138285 RepID=A0A5N6ZAG1_9EURO|nr:fungal-specific transcription factor domain-containing protein [Aspergillus coremiiformis]
MSNSNRPPPFHYPSYTSSPSSEYPGNEATFNDWVLPQYSQPSYAPSATYDTVAGFVENSAGTSAMLTGEQPSNSKVAIPRSANPGNWTSKGRVSRACEKCREQKAKCSGHRPTCLRCQEAGTHCSYGDRKREKMAKQLSNLTNQKQIYEALLRDLCMKVDSQTAQRIEQVMDEQRPSNDQAFGRKVSASLSTVRGANTPADPVSSLVALDYLNEDFNRDENVQAIGFVGEHSEIAWLHRLRRMLEGSSPVTPSLRESWDHQSVASMNFFLDDSDIPVIGNVDISLRPLPVLADQLLDKYFSMIHPFFPIMGKAIFLRQYKSFYSNPSLQPGKRWLAILNLIFAIAARYCHQVRSDAQETPDDGALHFSRAWKLSMSDVALLDHPNLQQVQVEGLASFYLMSVGQANRSWRICGTSVRSAVIMGLNLHNETSTVDHTSKETRYRVWWSIYMLDIQLSVMTGRSPHCSSDFCTTPHPVPFQEEEFMDDNVAQIIADNESRNVFMEALSSRNTIKSFDEVTTPEGFGRTMSNQGEQCGQAAFNAMESLTPNTSLYFLCSVGLGLIIRESIDTLYAPGAVRKSWREVEMAISTLNSKADAWLSQLPAAFHFTHGHQAFQRQRSCLAFCFYSAKILITQPCLSRLAQEAPGVEIPGNFCNAMGIMCVDLAGQMVSLLPDSPEPSWVYHVSPWWCVLHFLMQSTTVLLTDLLLLAKAGTVHHRTILEKVSKAMRWLAVMSTKDSSFQRAELVCRDLLSQNAMEPDIGAYTEDDKNRLL